MKIAVMMVGKNEVKMMPWTLRHYTAFADEITVYDNMSTDDTRQIVERCPIARYIAHDTGGVLRDDVHVRLKSEFRTECDWRILIDTDELVWHPQGVRPYLERCLAEGITLPHTMGFDLIGDGWPADDGKTQLVALVRHGVPSKWSAKLCVIHKDADVTYAIGAHYCTAFRGRVVRSPMAELRVLHCKWIDRDWQIARTTWLQQSLSPENLAHCWSVRDMRAELSYYELSRAVRREVVN
jgi:hypothetical protein